MKRKIAVIVLVVAILATSILAFAGCQKADYTIGIMENSEHVSSDSVMKGFRETLRELMRSAGKSVSYVYRKSNGDTDEKIAESEKGNAEYIKKKNANVILAISQSSATASQQYASEIPTVFAQSAIADRNLQESELKIQVQKQVELMTLIAPQSTTLGILYCTTDKLDADGNVTEVNNSKTKAEINQDLQVKIAEEYIKELGLQVVIHRYYKTEEKTHDTFVKDGLNDLKNNHGVGCVFMPVDNTLACYSIGPKIHERANTNIYTTAQGIEKREVANMPIVCGDLQMNEYFGVATYAFDNYELGAKAAREVFDILVLGKQTLYSEFKTDFSQGKYVINEKVAKDIGFEIPQSIKDKIA